MWDRSQTWTVLHYTETLRRVQQEEDEKEEDIIWLADGICLPKYKSFYGTALNHLMCVPTSRR